MSEVRAKKALGQHFLVDLNIARKICNSLSGGEIRLRTAPAVAALPGADGQAAAGRGPEEPETAVIIAAKRGTGNAAETGAAAATGDAAVAVDGRTAEIAAGPDVAAGAGPDVVQSTESGVVAGAGRDVAQETGPEGVSGIEPDVTPDAGQGAKAAGRCDVLEVGCGMGVLTQFLLRRDDIVTYGAEIDPESVEYLHAHYPEFTPRLMEGDFLKMNLRELFPGGLKIIGNFPYNISSQIFFKVLENRDLVPECVGMIQKEVAVRLAEPPGSKEYGILSVLLQAWYDIEYLFTVNETVFNPPPKVKSAVIRLRRNGVERLACDETLFVKVVKASFGQRRKMIRNSLRAVFGDFGGASFLHAARRAAFGRRLRGADRLGCGEQNVAVRSPCAVHHAPCIMRRALCVCGHTLCDHKPAAMRHMPALK